MPQKPKPPDFKLLDALLDQALALDDSARQEFLAQLNSDDRARVLKLLELSRAMTLGNLAEQASATIDNLSQNIEEKPNTASGRWRLQRELGSGGMGQVFFATRKHARSNDSQSGYEQHAAVKVLWSHRADTEVQARFFRERRILATLDHPGIARFLDGGFLTDGRPWFAMEYVDGIDVIEYADKCSLNERLTLFIDICASVAYAHERLIVHRDIKPQNVLVDEKGRARLLDFGVASIIDDVDDGLHTRTGGSPLTLQYASPEQVSGKLVSVASDIYQLGLLLYQMLTGKTAYDLKDLSLQPALNMICEQTPVAPSRHNPAIGPDLDAIVLTALNKAPNERYRSVTALAEDVQRFISGRPVKAIPHSPWYVARRFIQRHALIATVVTTSIVALAVATGISIHMASEARDQARRSAATQQILSDVFQKADPFGDGGANITLADALLKAKGAIAEQVSGDPILTWEVNYTLAEIYQSLGLVEQEAEAYQTLILAADEINDSHQYRRLTGVAGYGGTLARTSPSAAVAFFSEQLPGNPTVDIEVVPWLSAQYSYVGALARLRDFEQADAGTLKMDEVVHEFDVTTPRTRGRLSQLLAGVARRAADAEAEDKHWQDAVAYMRQTNKPSALAISLSNRAIHLGRNGRYEESDTAFREAITLYEEAGHQDPSLAGVLRSYAGLQFRMGQKHEAIATIHRALDLLGPGTEIYARFVAQLALVRFTLVTGDIEQALAVSINVLSAAPKEFESNPEVPRRMLEPFAKLLLFGDQHQLAAQVLELDLACADDDNLYRVLDTLEAPSEKSARDAIWSALDGVEALARDESLKPIDLDQAIKVYQQEEPAFFDVLDHWRATRILRTAAGLLSLPQEIHEQNETMATLKADTNNRITNQYYSEVSGIAEYFNGTFKITYPCN